MHRIIVDVHNNVEERLKKMMIHRWKPACIGQEV